jgi:hypothetical protein
MLDLNMPKLTDAGAKDLAAGARDFGVRASENLAKFAPSQTTTLVVCLLGFCWLGIKLYKEIKSGQVHHTVAHTPSTPPPPPPPST